MARQYQKTNWQNTPSTATPLSADNLNHIEDGIYDLETKVENNASAVSDLQSGKVDKVIGKGLSKNDFTDAYKTQIDDNTQDISINKSLIQSNTQSINNLYDIKVNKVTGKGLSTNDFTNNDVDKLRNDTYTKSETRGLVSKAYHPAGTIHVEDLVSSVLVNANLNNVYNLDGDGTTSNLFIEGAGHPLKDGTNIGVINFGTDESPNILFDDLGGFVDLSGYATTSAMNTALADKVDKISGKGLSTNDFTDIYKSQIETNQANVLTIFDRLETKVDKVTGKGLSTNDFTAEYINAINDNTDNISDNTIAIQTNATNITALQNNKVDKVVGKGLSTNDFTNNFKKGIAISQELAYDRATIPQPNLDADFHTVNGERSVIYQGNAYTFHTMTYNPISKKYVYGILCNPVYQGGLFFCEVDNPASDRHNWLDTTTFPTDILINGDIYTAVMPTGEAYYVSYSYNNNDEKELVYCNALDSSRLDYWIKTEIIINSIFNVGNYIFYVADNKVYKYEFAHGSVELDFDTVPFAYTYGGGRCIALTKNQYNVISAFMSYDGIEWTKVNFPSINKTNKPSGLIYDHGIFLFYQEDDEYVITSKDGFSWEKHKLSIDMTEFRENFMIFDEIGWGGGIFYACVNSVDEGHYDDYTIWTSQDGYTWEQTVKYLEDEIDNKTDYYNGTYLISVAQNLYYPTYRLDGVYGKDDVYTKSESDNKYVAKETGKGLSTNDYTTADKTKLAGISEGATQTIANPADTATETLSKLEVGGVVYDVPQGASGATELSELTDVNLTDVEDNNILQYDETANKWKNSNALQGSKTATGNPLTIEDAAPVNAVNLSMDLESIQDLHGYDYPWVGGAGKNKLPMTVDGIKAANTSGTWNGNVYSIHNGTIEVLVDNDNNVIGIKANGTPSPQLEFYMPVVSNLGNVIINGCTASGSDSTYFITSKQGSTWSSLYDYGNGYEREITSNESVVIVIRSGYNAQNLIFQPMIRLSTETDATFAPYTNKASISGRSEEAIQRVGKNLLKPQTTRNLKFGGSASTGYTLQQPSNTSLLMCGEVKVEGLNSVYLSGDLSALNSSTFRYTFTSEYPNVGVETFNSGAVGTNNAITVPTNAKWLVWGSGKTETQVSDEGGYTKLSNSAMINAGTTATTYEPYKGKTYTIQLGQTVYGGQLDVTRGKMVVDRGYAEFDGSSDENWVFAFISNSFYQAQLPFNSMKNSIGIISNAFETISTADRGLKNGIVEFTDYEIRVALLSDFGITSAELWKTWLSSNPLQVVYKLATPFTIDLTPQQIKLLENINTLYTDYEGDTITIEYQPNNAIGEAVRVVEESYDPEFAVRPVLKKKAFSGTTDSDGSVTLINASDIPSNHRIIPLQITDMTIGGSAGTYFVEYEPYNSGDSVKGYCYTYYNGSQITPVGTVVTGNFYYYDLEG